MLYTVKRRGDGLNSVELLALHTDDFPVFLEETLNVLFRNDVSVEVADKYPRVDSRRIS